MLVYLKPDILPEFSDNSMACKVIFSASSSFIVGILDISSWTTSPELFTLATKKTEDIFLSEKRIGPLPEFILLGALVGEFAPKFAQLNDDVLFGEVWSREDLLSARDRSIVTVTALMASGVLDSSLKFHIANAKKHGVTKTEMSEILTHAAFYAGWPKAWAAFNYAKEIYGE